MLRLRAAQMDAFDEVGNNELAEKLLKHLAANLPVPLTKVETEAAYQRIRLALTRARRWRLTWELCLADFAMADLRYGAAFDQQSDVRAAMTEIAAAENPDSAFFSLSSRVPAAVWTQLQSSAASAPPPEGTLHARLLNL